MNYFRQQGKTKRNVNVNLGHYKPNNKNGFGIGIEFGIGMLAQPASEIDTIDRIITIIM